MTKRAYHREQEKIRQILRLDETITLLKDIRRQKISELAVIVKDDIVEDRQYDNAEIPWDEVEHIINRPHSEGMNPLKMEN